MTYMHVFNISFGEQYHCVHDTKNRHRSLTLHSHHDLCQNRNFRHITHSTGSAGHLKKVSKGPARDGSITIRNTQDQGHITKAKGHTSKMLCPICTYPSWVIHRHIIAMLASTPWTQEIHKNHKFKVIPLK